MVIPAYLQTASNEYKRDKLSQITSKKFIAPYQSEDGIVLFVEDILGVTLKPYQDRILRKFYIHKSVAVQSLHGVGKTALAAWIVLWVITCHEGEVKVVTTASRWLQLVNYLWPEIHKWSRKADWTTLGIQLRPDHELLDRTIKLGHDKRAFATSPDKPEGIEGAHAKTLLYVFDEAKTIPIALFDSADGAFSNAGNDTEYTAYAFVISTPGNPIGRFFDICTKREKFKRWHHDRITLQEALDAGQISQEWVEEKALQWGEDDPRYINRVLGDFAQEGERSLYKRSWIEDAHDRWYACNGKGEPDGIIRYASDVADDGRDKSTLAMMRGWVVEYLHYWNCDTMELADKIMRHVAASTKANIIIDANGVGAGTYSRLKQQKYKSVKFKGSYGTDETDITGDNKFKNFRALSAWRLRELLDPSSLAFKPIALPPDDLLDQDLMAFEWWETNGVIRISEKDKHLRPLLDGRSTDGGDTIMMLAYLATRRREVRLTRL